MGLTSSRLQARRAAAEQAPPAVKQPTAEERLAARGAELSALRVENAELRRKLAELQAAAGGAKAAQQEPASEQEPEANDRQLESVAKQEPEADTRQPAAAPPRVQAFQQQQRFGKHRRG